MNTSNPTPAAMRAATNVLFACKSRPELAEMAAAAEIIDREIAPLVAACEWYERQAALCWTDPDAMIETRRAHEWRTARAALAKARGE